MCSVTERKNYGVNKTIANSAYVCVDLFILAHLRKKTSKNNNSAAIICIYLRIFNEILELIIFSVFCFAFDSYIFHCIVRNASYIQKVKY